MDLTLHFHEAQDGRSGLTAMSIHLNENDRAKLWDGATAA